MLYYLGYGIHTTLINFLQVLLPVSHNKYILQCLCRTKVFYHCSKDVMLVSHQPYRFTFSSSLITCYGFCFQVFNTEALIQYLGYSWSWVNTVLTLFPFKSDQVNALQASQSLKQLGWDGWNPIRFGTFTFIRRVGIECSGSDNNHTKGKVGVLMLNIGFPGKVLKVSGQITLYTRNT